MEPSQQSQESLNEQSGESSRPPEQVTEKSWIQKVKDKFLPGVKITLLISLIFYIAMFIIGIWGIRKCPANDNIPFFLIVTGGIGFVPKAISIVRESIMKNSKVHYVETSFYTVELVFLLLGSYWVFKVYKPSFNENTGNNYCNKTVYMFAYTYLITLYALVLMIALCFCCFLGCICFMKRTELMNNDPESPIQPIRAGTRQASSAPSYETLIGAFTRCFE